MDDDAVRQRIEKLVAEEHELWSAEAAGAASDVERSRLAEVGVQLDRLWELLRQRRALRLAEKDPGEAGLRDPETVETYAQ